MLGIPNLNTIYEDETGEVFIHNIGGENLLLVVHAEVIPTTNKTILRHYRNVMAEIFGALKAKGVPEVETWVITDEQMRFAAFCGFEPDGTEVKLEGISLVDPVYRMKKELT